MVNQLILYTNDNHHILPTYTDDGSGDERIFLDVFMENLRCADPSYQLMLDEQLETKLSSLVPKIGE